MGRYGTISAHEGSWVQGHEFRAYRAFTALSAYSSASSDGFSA